MSELNALSEGAGVILLLPDGNECELVEDSGEIKTKAMNALLLESRNHREVKSCTLKK